MSQLNQFFSATAISERVIGTYLYPYILFSESSWDDPYYVTEIIGTTTIGAEEILLTRNGGLFVRLPSDMSTPYGESEYNSLEANLKSKLMFEERVATYFNRIICELTLLGIISEPATPVHIGSGRLINDHALVLGGGGGREAYFERTVNPSIQLARGEWRSLPPYREVLAKKAIEQECAKFLIAISEDLPALVVGAYSLFSQRQLSEALIDSWIVCEQVVNYLWKNYMATLKDMSRIKRLSDLRTYTVAIRTEILHSVGEIPAPIYHELNKARKNRNDLAHGAKTTLSASTVCLNAMKLIIEFICKKTVAPPLANLTVSW